MRSAFFRSIVGERVLKRSRTLCWTAKETVLVGSETRSFVEGLELGGVVIGRHTKEVLIDFSRRGCDWCAKEDARS